MEQENSGPEKGVAQKSAMNSNLNRGLKKRHMSMIALGGAIGTGLFIGSAGGLVTAGPGGLLVAYTVTGLLMFFTMCGLAEVATYVPVTGTFMAYSERFVDRALGFAIGWTYWLSRILVIGTEFVAAGVLVSYWLPGTPKYIWGLVSAVIVFTFNIFHVKGFGEAEFWFALIKVIMILAFIVIGVCIVFGWLGDVKYGVSLWHYKDGPFVDGFRGTMFAFVFAVYAYEGSEAIGLTAGESKNPKKDVPAAILTLFYRVMLFYVVSIFLMGLILPYDDPSLSSLGLATVKVAPFTQVFSKAGIAAAPHIVNAVVLSSVLSACNTNLYTSSRLLYSLHHFGHAPKILAKTTKNGVPFISLILTECLGLLFIILAEYSNNAYLFLVNMSSIFGLMGWTTISIVHIFFRRAYRLQGYKVKDLPYRSPLYPFGPYFCLTFIAFIIGSQVYAVIIKKQTVLQKVSTLIGIPIFLGLYLSYKIIKRPKFVNPYEADLITDSSNYIDYTATDA
ncbi:Lysine-specific permease [Zancudomyces culisetae]|uniref:Lysine-specific permease n=1 Tax=Zancudomyces culisetae TaxID=1213189 RepID=A0A1R1PR12_ZANCU|nr:Lysine-specific permease [Zancudomyces culisetae]|eukprot:OMH83394.1 Lysine-specific permease [Zancudomyces culisetae]